MSLLVVLKAKIGYKYLKQRAPNSCISQLLAHSPSGVILTRKLIDSVFVEKQEAELYEIEMLHAKVNAEILHRKVF